MNWTDLAEKVKPFAPVLGAAIGGPVGPAIGVAAAPSPASSACRPT